MLLFEQLMFNQERWHAGAWGRAEGGGRWIGSSIYISYTCEMFCC